MNVECRMMKLTATSTFYILQSTFDIFLKVFLRNNLKSKKIAGSPKTGYNQ